jgi:radical SAM superfamily enzyme YgiQ (UPF0313 family)
LNELDILLVSPNVDTASMPKATAGRSAEEMTALNPYPIGLAYLDAALKVKGFSVETLSFNYYTFGHCFWAVMDVIKDRQVHAIGLQMLTGTRVICYHLIERIHRERPEIRIIVGGIHATVMYKQLLEKYPYIIVVIGEGEETLPELLRTPRQSLHLVWGIAYSDNGEVVRTKPRELIQDLDSLPFPSHEIFMAPQRTTMNILTSRGCPFHCSFCCLSSITHGKVRFRSVKNVVDEIETTLKRSPQINHVWIHDDQFFLDNSRVVEFCNEIMKRGINVQFTCSARFKPIRQDMIWKMEQAGFTRVYLGLESGQDDILRRCHKGITQKDAIKAFQMFKHSKIRLIAFLIVGLPGEDHGTMRETARFVKILQHIKYVYFNEIGILTIFPGTEVYDLAKAAGVIDDTYWLTDGPSRLYTAEHSETELVAYKDELLTEISIDRILTRKGFKTQFYMLGPFLHYLAFNPNQIPYHVKTLLSTAINGPAPMEARAL